MTSARRCTLGAAFLALALLGGACSSGDTTDGAAAPDGGGGDATEETDSTLVIATGGLLTGLDFDVNGGGYENAEARYNLHAGLLRNPFVPTDTPGEFRQDYLDFEPVLAESYEVSDDGTTFTFHLREDVLSQEGNPLDAEDIRYTIERKWALSTAIASTSLPVITGDPFEQLTIIDDHTIQWTIDQPGYSLVFLQMIASNFGTIYDSDALKENSTPEDPYATAWAAENNFGFGPYMVEDIRPGEQVTYVANPNFVLGPPPYGRIIQRQIADPGTRISALQNGDVDIAAQVRPSDQAQVADDPAVRVPAMETNMYTFIPLNTSTPPFDNLAVREAFAHAIPYEEIIDEVYLGQGSQLNGVLLPDMPGNVPADELPMPTYDPDEALSILGDAGVTTPVKATLVVDSSFADLVDAAVRIRTAATEAGFDLTIEELPTATFLEGRTEGAFEMFIVRDYAILQAPSTQLLLFTRPESSINWAKWNDPHFLELIDLGFAAGDPRSDEAAERWQDALIYMESQHPYLWVTRTPFLMAYSADVSGFSHVSANIIYYEMLEPADTPS